MWWRSDEHGTDGVQSRLRGVRERPDPWRFLLWRTLVALLTLAVAASLVFFAIHLGPRAPVDAQPREGQNAAALEQKKAAFGLYDPLWVQYADYMADTFTLNFGESWTSRSKDPSVRAEPITNINRLVFGKLLPRTAWLWLWAALVALAVGVPVGLALGYSDRSWTGPGATVSGALLRAAAVFVMATFVDLLLSNSETLLFGFDWTTFVVPTTLKSPIRLANVIEPTGFLRATKHVLPAAVAVAAGLVGTAVRLGERAVGDGDDAASALGARARGVDRIGRAKRVLRRAALPLTSSLSANAAVLVGASVFAEIHLNLRGVGHTFVEAVGHGDYTTAQAIAFVFVLVVALARLAESVLYVALVGAPTGREERSSAYWTGIADGWGDWDDETRPERLESLTRYATADLGGRIRSTPRPALAWVALGGLLVAVEFGAVLDALALAPGVPPLPDVPTLLSRELWPNMGHRTPGGGWTGTAFGLPPAYAWALRVGLVFAYAAAWVGWVWLGYRIYASVYREVDHTPTDAAVERFTSNRWAVFGFAVVFVFLVAGVFGPTLGPTTFNRVSESPGPQATIQYLDGGEVRLTTTTIANYETESNGQADTNVGPMQYDQFGRFHPFGTGRGGADLFTGLLTTLRTSLLVGSVATAVGMGIALISGLLSGTRRGLFDAGSAFAAETAAVLPMVPMAFLLVDQFEPVLSDSSAGTLLLSALIGLLAWPMLWRTLRAPVARAASGRWVEAAEGFNADRRTVLRRHLLPRIAGHASAYATLTFLGAMIAYATIRSLWGGTLSYLRVSLGPHVTGSLLTVSWHTTVFPVAVAVVVFLGFVALADGIRDAVDPERVEGISGPGETVGAGGAG